MLRFEGGNIMPQFLAGTFHREMKGRLWLDRFRLCMGRVVFTGIEDFTVYKVTAFDIRFFDDHTFVPVVARGGDLLRFLKAADFAGMGFLACFGAFGFLRHLPLAEFMLSCGGNRLGLVCQFADGTHLLAKAFGPAGRFLDGFPFPVVFIGGRNGLGLLLSAAGTDTPLGSFFGAGGFLDSFPGAPLMPQGRCRFFKDSLVTETAGVIVTARRFAPRLLVDAVAPQMFSAGAFGAAILGGFGLRRGQRSRQRAQHDQQDKENSGNTSDCQRNPLQSMACHAVQRTEQSDATGFI